MSFRKRSLKNQLLAAIVIAVSFFAVYTAYNTNCTNYNRAVKGYTYDINI